MEFGLILLRIEIDWSWSMPYEDSFLVKECLVLDGEVGQIQWSVVCWKGRTFIRKSQNSMIRNRQGKGLRVMRERIKKKKTFVREIGLNTKLRVQRGVWYFQTCLCGWDCHCPVLNVFCLSLDLPSLSFPALMPRASVPSGLQLWWHKEALAWEWREGRAFVPLASSWQSHFWLAESLNQGDSSSLPIPISFSLLSLSLWTWVGNITDTASPPCALWEPDLHICNSPF